jgi:hypothetical protein
MSRPLDHFDSPDWRDDAPKLHQCDGDRCLEYETPDEPFFWCPECTETLCPGHCGEKHTFYGIEMCEACYERNRDKAAEAYYSNGGQ